MQAGMHIGQVPVQTGWTARTQGWIPWDQGAAAQETRTDVVADGRR